jgi:hypothetical protein
MFIDCFYTKAYHLSSLDNGGTVGEASQLSICKPRNFVFTASSIYLSLYEMFNGYCEFSVKSSTIFFLSRFRDSLFAENYLII